MADKGCRGRAHEATPLGLAQRGRIGAQRDRCLCGHGDHLRRGGYADPAAAEATRRGEISKRGRGGGF